ncbi:unnamed protein product, partial [Rotaria sp. Silwood1]
QEDRNENNIDIEEIDIKQRNISKEESNLFEDSDNLKDRRWPNYDDDDDDDDITRA